MNKKTVEKLRQEYLSITKRDGRRYQEEWYISNINDLDYVWSCSSFEAALARVIFWNAESQYRHETEGEKLRRFVIQNEKGVLTKEQLIEEMRRRYLHNNKTYLQYVQTLEE